MKYKHIIWDWNGTLLNDLTLCVDLLNVSLEKRKLPEMTEEKYRKKFLFPIKTLEEQVDFFGITHLLDNVVGISNTPSGYGKEFEGKELLNNTDIPLEQTIIVGDSMLDFTVSTALSIDCALLSNGHNNLERLQATGSKTFANIQLFSNWILD